MTLTIEEQIVQAVEVIAEASREDAVNALFEMYRDIKNLRAGMSIDQMRIDSNEEQVVKLQTEINNLKLDRNALVDIKQVQDEQIILLKDRYQESLDTINKLKAKLKRKK